MSPGNEGSEGQARTPKVICLASGKGGVGKSLIAANLGTYLATLGKDVVAVDASLGNPSLHRFLGLERNNRSLSQFFADKSVSLNDLRCDSMTHRLQVIGGQQDPSWMANPKVAQLNRFRSQLHSIDADYVLLDLGSGTSGHNIDLFLASDERILVTLPEPASVELSYRFLKAAFARRARRGATSSLLESQDSENGFLPSPLDVYRKAGEVMGADAAERVRKLLLELQAHLVVNHTRTKGDMEFGPAMVRSAQIRLGVPLSYLGHLDFDDAVWVALRRSRPLLVDHPESRASKCIERLSRKLLSSRATTKAPTWPPWPRSHYELLELDPGASEEETRRAQRRIFDRYGKHSIVTAGLYSDASLEELHQRISEAYDTLIDPERRRAYDQVLFPEGVPSRLRQHKAEPKPAKPLPPAERPPMPDLRGVREFSGQLLRQVRESKGLNLREISERTKIGMSYLAAIEEENFTKLPAMVYTRGFLIEYAKMLELKVEPVLESYLLRLRGQ